MPVVNVDADAVVDANTASFHGRVSGGGAVLASVVPLGGADSRGPNALRDAADPVLA